MATTVEDRNAHVARYMTRKPRKKQADQGRRERGVLCTRATEDAEMRRLSRGLQIVVVEVVARDLGQLIAVELGCRDRWRLHRDAGELALAVIGDRVVGRRRYEDQVSLGDLLGVAGDGHRARAADDDVDLLSLFVRVQRLLGAD